ncbi:hypothetical protein [Nostoc mirabile]|uniref:hypothetical protein n=1 Tax=Nostoc mirabile TaxID=2907820 RepID=UPI001E5D3D96|nr:hypothetical protein [Nostoc mirabile]
MWVSDTGSQALAQAALWHGSTPFPTGRYANGYATSATLSTSQGKPLTSRSMTTAGITSFFGYTSKR